MANRLTRKEFLRLAGVGVGGAVLAACVPPSGQVAPAGPAAAVQPAATAQGETQPAAAAPAGEKPLLRFAMYNFDPWLAALPKMFNDFEAEVGTAQVKLETAPWDQFWARFESQAAAGIAPDLQIGDPSRMARYADTGIYLDVDPYIEKDKVDLNEWLPASIEACRYEKATGLVGKGAVYGMPATLVGTILYFNKELFDKAGVAYPNDKWTRLDLEQAAIKLTSDSAGKHPGEAGFNADDIQVYGVSTVGGYSTAVHLWNNGGGLISDDQKECWMSKPESVEIFQWLGDLVLTKKANPDPAWFQGQPDVFLTQRLAMTMDGSWNLDTYVEKLTFPWDIADVPLGTKNLPRVTYAGTNTLHIYGGTKYKDQSWALLKFLSGPGGQKYFLRTGTPCLISAAGSKDYMTGKPDHRQIAVDVGKYGRTYYPYLGSDKWKAIYDQEIQAIFLGEGDAKTVTAKICDKIAPILANPRA